METPRRKNQLSLPPRPHIQLPLHKKQLKGALLSGMPPARVLSWKENIRSFFYPLSFLFMKSWKNMALVSFAVLAILLTYQAFRPAALIHTVSAREIIAQVSAKLQTLSPAELTALEQKINDNNIYGKVKEAFAANDLKDCAVETCGNIKSFTSSNGDFHILQYTNPEGVLILLGIDKENLPHFIINNTEKDLTITDFGQPGNFTLEMNDGTTFELSGIEEDGSESKSEFTISADAVVKSEVLEVPVK